MVRVKKAAMRLFLILEMVAFGYLYIAGKNGMQSLGNQRSAVVVMEHKIAQLNTEVVSLEKEIYVWQTDDFYKEKVAREQLQMARKGDELFYIGA
jgi:cell division protein FtsB